MRPPDEPAPRAALAFLPAVQAIESTPPLPAARWISRAILCLCGIALLWAWLAWIDVVAIASGRLVASGRTKIVQPLDAGIVQAVRVTEGERVRAGQVLVELDPTLPRADRARLARERRALSMQRARLDALLRAVAGESQPRLADLPADAGAAELARERARLERELAAFAAETQALRAERSGLQAARAAVDSRLTGLQAVLPLVAERARAARAVADRALAPRSDWLALEQARIEQVRDIDVQRRERARLEAAMAAVDHRLAALAASRQAQWLGERDEVGARLDGVSQDLLKAGTAVARQRILAPVSGTVQQIAVHTVGGVVTPAQPLMAVVPDGDHLLVQAAVLNRDVGFVRAGQRAVVKIETFPFTRYGFIRGVVTQVSADAVADERQGLAFSAHVRLDSTVMRVDGRDVPLAPGMRASVEIAVGRRRVADLILSPLARRVSEAGRER
ncbi:MAG: HlyD family type I secretion periplasmic adaptor subunit [Gammaproteobacteria bacterium]